MSEKIYNQGPDNLRRQERIDRLEIPRVLDLCLKGKDIKSIIDIGTGSGVFAEAFYNAGLQVAGIDLNPEMIEAAKTYLPECDFRVAVAEQIPFPDNSFDAAFFGVVFHEVSDYKAAMSEAFRVSRLYTFILEWQYRSEDFGPPLEHRLKSETIADFAKEAGFAKIETFEMKTLVMYRMSQ